MPPLLSQVVSPTRRRFQGIRTKLHECGSLFSASATRCRDFNAGCGSTISAVAFAAVGRYWVPLNRLATGQRLLIAAKTDLFVVLWLAIAISNVARLRFIAP